jgi:hypothetical protein
VPASQGTPVAFTDCGGHQLPAGDEHDRQATAPDCEYVPSGHSAAVALVDASAHTKPALQLVQATAPSTLKVPAGHADAVALADPRSHK